MNVYDFLQKAQYLNLSNSVLNINSKVNPTLLDYTYASIEASNENVKKANITCNVIISKQSDENTLNIKMSGSTKQNSDYCYDTLEFYLKDKQGKFTGTSYNQDSDSYKLMYKPTSTSTGKSTSSSKGSFGSSSDSVKSQIEKIVYAPPVGSEINEEINRIKKIMLL